jgi:hypothetical protein
LRVTCVGGLPPLLPCQFSSIRCAIGHGSFVPARMRGKHPPAWPEDPSSASCGATSVSLPV